jgi:hypothetical protein
MNREKITKIVHEVLKERGWATESSQKPLASRENKSKKGPAVLNVFHAGVRKLETALEQVQLIEATARRSSVYTVESARDKVSGADVKEKAGTRCILDTVKPDGLERILQKADILVLPTFCLKTAARVASLMCDDQESTIVFTALLQGKKVLATQDGFMIYKSLVNDRLREEIKQLLKKLEGFGMIFCPTDRLNATFQKMAASGEKTQATAGPKAAGLKKEKTANAVKLITAKVINTAVDNKQDMVRLAPGGKVTPLGRDLAKEYAIKIIQAES